jgi:hypothetical protein
MEELTNLRTETGKMFDAGKDKTGRPSYTLEARTGPIHYKEAYKDTDSWLDLDETYCEPGELKGIGKVLVYPRLPNIVTVFQDRCGYQIQSRSNPDHVARVELVSIDGQNATAWQDSAALKTSVRVHPYRVGIWKDFSAASKAKATTMRWKVTELGNNGKDSHPFAFREVPEAYNVADLTNLDPEAMEQAKIAIQTARTRIDDNSWYWDELIPAEAKLVDTDWEVGASADDGYWAGGVFYNYKLVIFASDRNAFCRFTNISIPPTSIINTCYATFVCALGNASAFSVNIHFEKALNPSAPTSGTDANNRKKTTNYVNFSSSDTWYEGSTYNTPGIETPFQEVINQSGWASGNAVVLYLLNVSGTNRRCADYDHTTYDGPKLTSTWTEPTGSPFYYYQTIMR